MPHLQFASAGLALLAPASQTRQVTTESASHGTKLPDPANTTMQSSTAARLIALGLTLALHKRLRAWGRRCPDADRTSHQRPLKPIEFQFSTRFDRAACAFPSMKAPQQASHSARGTLELRSLEVRRGVFHCSLGQCSSRYPRIVSASYRLRQGHRRSTSQQITASTTAAAPFVTRSTHVDTRQRRDGRREEHGKYQRPQLRRELRGREAALRS